MSFEKITKILVGDTPGRSTELNYFHIGPQDATRKVYLQAALHAAGSRTSITSLWKVDDAATRRLFEVFYTDLWIEKLPVAEALWRAKVVLREEGHAPRDWAGWVLTGDPD